jgi:hypothetical protein
MDHTGTGSIKVFGASFFLVCDTRIFLLAFFLVFVFNITLFCKVGYLFNITLFCKVGYLFNITLFCNGWLILDSSYG